MALAYRYALVCDEIRREDSGKLLLVGVYTPNIAVASVPIRLRSMAFLLGFEADAPGEYKLKFKLTHLETGMTLFGGEARVDVKAAGFVAVPLQVPAAVQIMNAGVYAISIESDGGEPNAYTFSVVEKG